MSYQRIFFAFIIAIPLLFSCASRKRIVYFKDIETINKTDTLSYVPQLTIQPGDILQVTVSTINKDISELYNPLPNTYNNANPAAQGYLVDRQGYVELPQIGKIYAKGKTTEALNVDIKTEIDKLLKNAFVSTRLINFRISVLGDVARPGNYSIQNEKISVLEALSLAGDVNYSARRNDVLLIRERDGKRTYVTIDLNDSKAFSSPYYYMANNDILYVRPGVNRAISSTTALQLLPIAATTISLLLVIYTNAIKK